MTRHFPLLMPYTHGKSAPSRVYSYGKGVYLYTTCDAPILDGLSGSMNANLGHGNAVIAAAMHQQALGLTSLPSIAGDVSEDAVALADQLCLIVGARDSSCVFASSGSEATETALAVVWKYWSDLGQKSKRRILSMDKSYHGCTLGALTITGRADEHVDIPAFSSSFRVALPAWGEPGSMRVSDALKLVLASEGVDAIAAIFLEPVMGLAGMIPAPERDFKQVVELCRENNVLIVLDEALTALGRIGHVTAAHFYEVDYDLLLMSKGLGCGFVPIAATLVRPHVASVLRSASPILRHGHTASGNPLATRVASTVLEELSTNDAFANARQMGEKFKSAMSARLRCLDREYAFRSTGLCSAIETHDAPFAQKVQRTALEIGLRIRAIDQSVVICPPLIISSEEIDQLVELLARALITADTGPYGREV